MRFGATEACIGIEPNRSSFKDMTDGERRSPLLWCDKRELMSSSLLSLDSL